MSEARTIKILRTSLKFFGKEMGNALRLGKSHDVIRLSRESAEVKMALRRIGG